MISSRTVNILLVAVLAAGVTLLATLAHSASGGPLDPSGPPASTAATEITSLPYTISSPGAYVLKRNLTGTASTDGITVSANDVSIDLNGFELIGPASSGFESGIATTGFTRNLAVRNGTLRGWRCSGINAGNNQGGRFDDIRAFSNGGGCSGMAALSFGAGGNATNCLAENNSGAGVATLYGTINGCTARLNGAEGFNITQGAVRDCIAANNFTGISVTRGIVNACTIVTNASAGIFGDGEITNNTISGNGTGATSPGIDLTSYGRSLVARNTISSNSGDGIRLQVGSNYLLKNQLSGNGSSGIYVKAGSSYNRVDGNSISGSVWGIYVDGINNAFVRNSAGNIANLKFFIGGFNNISGPQQGVDSGGTPVALSNPWANIGH